MWVMGRLPCGLPRGQRVLHCKWQGDEAYNQGDHPDFETPNRHHHRCKTGASVTPQKGLRSMSSKNVSEGNMQLAHYESREKGGVQETLRV